jgi:RNA polymerase sigma-70 factor (ECF subfamily)
MRLFLANQRRFYGLLLSLVPNTADADDLLQDVSVRMWERFDDFELGTDFGAWGMQFTRHAAMKFFEARRARGKVQFNAALLDAIADEFEAISAEVDPRAEALRGCIEKLPVESRRIVELRYAPGATTQTVADAMGRTIFTVYKSLNRIHDALLQCVRRTLAAEGRP